MINFSKISAGSLWGKTLRGVLKIIPKKFILPILQGRLKGKKWVLGSGTFGYWLGTYEMEKQKIFEKALEKRNIVYDIGAHVGFYSLLAAELIGEKGKVFSFEPNPGNVFYLKKHISMNKFENIQVFEAAVSETTGTALFSVYQDSFSGQFSENGKLSVKTIAIDDLLADGKVPPPDVMKIDVEGAEFKVLKGVIKTLGKYHPTILLATHNEKIRNDCHDFLRSLDYDLRAIVGNDIETADEILAYFGNER